MKLIICGAGQVGHAICESLWKMTDIVLIDKDENKVNELYSTYDIQAIVGSATSLNILREADLQADDIFLAVTNSDETNIIASVMASNLGVKRVYGRVRSSEYLEDMNFMQNALGISKIVNPEMDAATLIYKILQFPAANSMESFANDHIKIIELTVDEDSKLAGQSLFEFREQAKEPILVCVVQRGDKITIPNGSFRICPGDKIHVTGATDNLTRFYREHSNNFNIVRRLLIIGGGNLTHYLLELLPEKGPIYVKVIEDRLDNAKKLALDFPWVDVVYGDSRDPHVLREEGVDTFDAVCSLKHDDDANIIISSYAKSLNIPKVITKVDQPWILQHLSHLGLDTIITPKQLLAEKMIRLIRSLRASQSSSIIRLYQMLNDQIEAMEFKVLEDSAITEKPLKDIHFKANTLLIGIHRNNKDIIPNGNDQIQVGDYVSLITMQKNIKDINQFVE